MPWAHFIDVAWHSSEPRKRFLCRCHVNDYDRSVLKYSYCRECADLVEQGFLSIVLHAHLPFVRHPEHDDFLEEDWLYEAITEVYIPLLDSLGRLERDGIDFRLTLSISPTLASMLADALLQERYLRHLDNLTELASREVERTRWLPAQRILARMYLERFQRCRQVFVQEYGNNLLQGFRHFFETNRLELMTCAATHGYLPLMTNAKACWAQIEIGCREFERHFGRRPKGIWLPECGYMEGLDIHLRDAGLEYFFVDTHGLLFADPRPYHGVYAPVVCPESGLLAFGRDADSSVQVWSSQNGYPGDPWYRDFYRDVGFDLEYSYLEPFLHSSGIRGPTGIKYHRVTGRTDEKALYEPEIALERVHIHAEDFIERRGAQVRNLANSMPVPPIVVAPYDAELFGHWWYEGPLWLEQVLRLASAEQNGLQATTIPDYMKRRHDYQVSQPATSSWGNLGYSGVWLEPANDWIYPHLHAAADRMVALAHEYPDANGRLARGLNQAARELLLAQSSDWAFIMKTGTMVEYAINRTRQHIANFHRLHEQIRVNQIDDDWLRDLESRHNLFPTLHYRIYA